MSKNRAKAMKLMREASELLEGTGGTIIMPGWDLAAETTSRPGSIRFAATAIAADGISPDEGTKVTLSELGTLVRYAADMLEE